eukprot:CAMPEP_0174251420 /NCGR_PEP_ID=MMETSP0439-20130205/1245_1 /TAXON_ID=0 /ORGANISM="Stereomyxa ramosa, Strain Chinc5" /LENGTH=862 /DNA_ID=CAMNT_0015331723 /DNA_START=83 /DNA_END=2672 /DNA_ORIENTATION=+
MAKTLSKKQLNKSDNFSFTALHWAAQKGESIIVEILLQKGVDINKVDQEGQTPLHFAVDKNHKNVVLLLLLNNANVNQLDKFSHSALHRAVALGHCGIVKVLLAHGADPNLQNGNGWTVAHVASYYGRKEIVTELLKCKHIDLNIQNKDGWTALHCASMQGFPEIVSQLIRAKCNINSVSNDGSTPLHLATAYDHLPTALLLLNCGANGNLRNSEGKRAFDLAGLEIKNAMKAPKTPALSSVFPERSAFWMTLVACPFYFSIYPPCMIESEVSGEDFMVTLSSTWDASGQDTVKAKGRVTTPMSSSSYLYFQAYVTPRIAGWYSLTVSYKGEELIGSPWRVKVFDVMPDLEKCKLINFKKYVFASIPVSFSLKVVDQLYRKITKDIEITSWIVSGSTPLPQQSSFPNMSHLLNPSNWELEEEEEGERSEIGGRNGRDKRTGEREELPSGAVGCEISVSGTGRFDISYVLHHTGEYELHLFVNHKPLLDSPFPILVLKPYKHSSNFSGPIPSSPRHSDLDSSSDWSPLPNPYPNKSLVVHSSSSNNSNNNSNPNNSYPPVVSRSARVKRKKRSRTFNNKKTKKGKRKIHNTTGNMSAAFYQKKKEKKRFRSKTSVGKRKQQRQQQSSNLAHTSNTLSTLFQNNPDSNSNNAHDNDNYNDRNDHENENNNQTQTSQKPSGKKSQSSSTVDTKKLEYHQQRYSRSIGDLKSLIMAANLDSLSEANVKIESLTADNLKLQQQYFDIQQQNLALQRQLLQSQKDYNLLELKNKQLMEEMASEEGENSIPTSSKSDEENLQLQKNILNLQLDYNPLDNYSLTTLFALIVTDKKTTWYFHVSTILTAKNVPWNFLLALFVPFLFLDSQK